MRFPALVLPSLLAGQTFDIILQRGRMMDPGSGLDAVRSIAISSNKIAAISKRPFKGW
jgi:N-acyl-D-glutamate deacylase